MKKRRGQSILEYTLVLAVIIGIVAYTAFKVLKPKTQDVYDRAGKAVDDSRAEIEGQGIFGVGQGD